MTYPNQSFHGVLEQERRLVGNTKIYLASIHGRNAFFDWQRNDLSIDAAFDTLGEQLREIEPELPTFAILLPHTSLVWAWGDPRVDGMRETNYSQVARTEAGMGIRIVTPLEDKDRWLCGLDGLISFYEQQLWYQAPTVEAYFETWGPNDVDFGNSMAGRIEVVNKDKLAQYLGVMRR